MTKRVSNTLTRWHKVAEHLKTAADEAQAQIDQALAPADNIDFDTFEVRREAMEANAAKVKEETEPLHDALVDALFVVRRKLAHANVQHGVADLLNEIEHTKLLIARATANIDAASSALSPAEFSELGRRRAAQPQNSAATDTLGRVRGAARPRLTLRTAGELAEKVANRTALRLKQTGLANRLADANATRIEIDIDERVAAAIGL